MYRFQRNITKINLNIPLISVKDLDLIHTLLFLSVFYESAKRLTNVEKKFTFSCSFQWISKKIRIRADLKAKMDIIAIISASLIGPALKLVIMCVETF